MTVASNVSKYEIDRNKPMPNRIHGEIQTQILVNLTINYGDKYSFPSEVSLATNPGSTPDIAIFPKKKLSLKVVKAKEEEAPITTIEIQSPFQSIEELQHKIWDLYFPMGVQSAWIVIPSMKAVKILYANDKEEIFNTGEVKDAVTGIIIELAKIFACME
ncbi:MAG: Uma2 family endonuclease [Bacteroidota bacterium]